MFLRSKRFPTVALLLLVPSSSLASSSSVLPSSASLGSSGLVPAVVATLRTTALSLFLRRVPSSAPSTRTFHRRVARARSRPFFGLVPPPLPPSSIGDAPRPPPSRSERIRNLLDRIDDLRRGRRRRLDVAAMDRAVAESSSDALDIWEGVGTRSTTVGDADRDGHDSDDDADVVHYVFLVHGWLGNDSEMGYLDDALRDVLLGPSSVSEASAAVTDVSSSSSADFGAGNVVVHRATCNNGRTTDGIAPGGSRLVEEIAEFIKSDLRSRIFDDGEGRRRGGGNGEDDVKGGALPVRRDEGEKEEGSSGGGGDDVHPSGTKEGGRATTRHVTVSFVGNSLGGLYSRYAAAHLPETFTLTSEAAADATATATATVPPLPPSPASRRSSSSRFDLSKSSTTSFDTALTSAPSSSVDDDDEDGGFYMLAEQGEEQSEEEGPEEETITVVLHPNVFCTTATPHLGVASHTYLPIPRLAERAIGNGMAETGRDLFRLSSSLGVAAAKGGPEEEGNKARADAAGGVSAGIAAVEVPRSNPAAAGDDAAATEPRRRRRPAPPSTTDDDDKKPKDLIYEMSTSPLYLDPLSKFRRRIAYANAFRTDFQVPTKTAAFLCERSGYPHLHRRRTTTTTTRKGATPTASASTSATSVPTSTASPTSSSNESDGAKDVDAAKGADNGGVNVAAAATTARWRGSFRIRRRGKRDKPVAPSASTATPDRNVEPDDGRRKIGRGGGDPDGEGRSFVVMALETERRYEISTPPPRPSPGPATSSSPPSSPSSSSSFSSSSDVAVNDDNGVLEMSESLDSLGWTKVFVDVRDRIPAPSVSLPFFRRKDSRTELDDFLEKRHSSNVSSSSSSSKRDGTTAAKPTTDDDGGGGDDGHDGETTVVRISSKELVDLMNPSERLHVPLGHTVMVANSKSEWYSKINARGRPVMDKLAKDLVSDVKGFRRRKDE